MGYQESWLYIEPQHKFKKLIQAYEKAEQSGYYEVAGAEPHSVIVLKQPFGDIPAGKKLLWVCGDRGFHCAAGVFGGELKCSGRLRVIPVEAVLNGTDDPRMEGLDFDSPAPSENAYMKRYSVANYAHRMRRDWRDEGRENMSTKDELETKLYEKMSQENEVFLAEMKTKSPDEIISHAYEIACRDNLLILFEDETSLSERQLTVLNEFEHPLSQLYTDWLSRDTDEMDAFRDSIACCANDILRKRVEEKYRDPAQPIYPNTRSEAVVRGEIFEWMASRDRTLTCAGTFEKDATSAYNDGKLPAFLKEWTNTYGKDRCMFVLACTMRQRTGDERFYLPARQAAGRFAALQKQMGGHTDVYAVDNHSCVINAAMEELAKPERSVEQKTVKKNTPER